MDSVDFAGKFCDQNSTSDFFYVSRYFRLDGDKVVRWPEYRWS